MTDMRQKLLPVFLEESGRMILQLNEFLVASEGGGSTLEGLEAAFRAAHTLKGTAALVQADAVCALSGRIEGMLEGHFEAGRFPSRVEVEAMHLALDRLGQLVDAIRQDREEPAGILSEAELALKLAAAMPGQRKLSELVASPQQDDPFADDPVVDLVDQPASTYPEDLFADDPGFEVVPKKPASAAADPFSEDPPLEPAEQEPVAQIPVTEDPFAEDPDPEPEETVAPVAAPEAEAPVDPFAEDPEPEAEPVAAPGTAMSGHLGEFPHDPFGEDPELHEELVIEEFVAPRGAEESGTTAETTSSEAVEEKPAESYAEKMRRRLESESAVGTAERLASTLLSQRASETVERNFSCCRFAAGGKMYYLPIDNMIEISDLPPIIRLPLAPPVVRGLINLRGKVMPVIDLSVRSENQGQYVAVKKLVVAEAGGEQLAFLADGIPDLAEDAQGEKVDVATFVEQFRAGAT